MDWNHLPKIHREFLQNAVPKLKEDERILGVTVGGSALTNEFDEFSDLDFVVAIDTTHYKEVLEERKTIVAKIAPLLEGFTGEHVGEPRLLICLYGPPILHVDFKFVSLEEIHYRVEDPIVVWERDKILTQQMLQSEAKYPPPNLVWIEERFWVWCHYLAVKIGRGELLEAVDFLSYLRNIVLGPMALHICGARPQGVRRMEQYGKVYLDRLKSTVPQYCPKSCLQAGKNAIFLYEDLRKQLNSSHYHKEVEMEVKRYIAKLEDLIN